MVFSGTLFIYYFLPLVLLAYYISPGFIKNTVLFASSLIFYAWGEPVYIFLMLFSIAFNYIIAILMDKYSGRTGIKKFFLILAVMVDIGILGFYKYSGFAVEIINSAFKTQFTVGNIPLPVGISFYTFQIISYVIDVYRNNAKAQKNPILIGTYISLFPQLIAGPIVKYTEIEGQLSGRKETADLFFKGVGTFCAGLAKKVLLANNIGMLWQTVASTPVSDMSVMNAWLGIIAFALQIYYDFSGYSDMAIGLGRMFGFELEINFNYPYISKSITEFWRRWHISLGAWFKEYLYYPLGGNRRGAVRTCVNLLTVWLLTGLWHGASANFVVWGLYYGILLIIEKMFLIRVLRKLPKLFSHLYAMLFVLIGWVIFECGHLSGAVQYIKLMFGSAVFVNSEFLYNIRSYFVIIVIGLVGILPFPREMLYRIFRGKSRYAVTILLAAASLLVCTAYLMDSTYNPFLYFRF